MRCDAVECFPTNVRTSAMGVLSAAGRLGAISAQFVNGSLERNIPLLLFVTSACSVVGGLTAWMLPVDTAGASMSAVEASVPVSVSEDDGEVSRSRSGIGIGIRIGGPLKEMRGGGGGESLGLGMGGGGYAKLNDSNPGI
jgi:hypothetical protein